MCVCAPGYSVDWPGLEVKNESVNNFIIGFNFVDVFKKRISYRKKCKRLSSNLAYISTCIGGIADAVERYNCSNIV